MKTKNFLSRFSAAALLAAALIPAALTSCSSDSEPTPAPDPIPEGMAQINLSFAAPSLEVGTRAGEETAVSAEEGKLNSLWVYFFKQGDNTSELKYAFSIPTSGTTDVSDNTFQTGASLKPIQTVTTTAKDIITGMNVEPATYHIYVLANLDGKCNDLNPTNYASISEADVTGAAFSTTDGTFALSAGLPMAADKTDLKNVSNATYTSSTGNLVVNAGSVSLTAEMTILCSKVRYTLFFDCTNESSISWPYQSFALQENALTLNNANTADKVFAVPEKSASTEVVSLNPSRKNYPEGNLDESWFGNSYQADLTGEGSGEKQYVYQGYVYLNEDPSLVVDNKTNLKFNTVLGVAGTTGTKENKTFTVVLPNRNTENSEANKLCKGTYYDVVGKITGSGFDVQVKIIDWVKAPADNFEF
ncbi:MAG: hypothetical protein K2M63_08780 [Muribaculaceae bacterium]|nr:hypothetical protein [Muribaculaceae bacterium]